MSARALSRSRMDAQVTLQYKVHEIANGGQGRCAGGQALRYSALMLASRITFPHFAESARMRAANSSGKLRIEWRKLEARPRWRNCGPVKMRCGAALSWSTTGRAVPAGANSPYQEPAS